MPTPSAENLLREARDASLRGDDERSRAALSTLCSLDPALGSAARAAAAAYVDDLHRARHWLSAGPDGGADVDALRLVARATLAERRGAPEPSEAAPTGLGPLLDGEVRLALAALARRRGRGDLARRALDALGAGDPWLAARAHQARALVLAMEGDLPGAKSELDAALAAFATLGARRAGGRALLTYARVIAPALPSDGGPATWLARARAELGELATARDRREIREGFRLHGRRLPDAALGERTLARMEGIEEMADAIRGVARLADERAARPDGALDALVRDVDARSRELEEHARGLLDILAGSAVEQGRVRALARALAPLDRLDEQGAFAAAAAAAIADILQADDVVLAVRGASGELGAIGGFSVGSPPGPERFRAPMEAALRAPSSVPPEDGLTREESRPRGPTLAVPLRAAGLVGALFADKRAGGGLFRDADLHLLVLGAELLSQGLARIAAHAAERAAFAELGATLEAIRDGVVAVDAGGVVRSSNAAAARMLRVPGGLVGRHVDDLPQLASLFGLLRGSQRVDGAVVRLAHGSVVVTARPIADGRGAVATLVELDRAQRMAVKITQGKPRYSFADILGRSDAMQDVLRMARRIADVDASVLITGESGTGKEVLAQAIHTGGARANEPFVGINCAALPRELLEAELFGYDRGAFTGARSEGAPGKFELACDGTILLDEIGDMPLDMQVKLLRVLQERVVVRLGGSSERPIGARVIATTHRDLDALVERGAFRLDLLYRLRVLHLHVPSLRDRGDDVVELAQAFTERVARAQRKALAGLSPQLLGRLTEYRWPGNVRELANVVEREVSLASATATTLEHLAVPLGASARDGGFPTESPSSRRLALTTPAPTGPGDVRPLAEVERRAYLDALSAFSGNVSRAAKALGVSRATFYVKLREYDVNALDEPGPETLRKIRFVEGKKGG